MIIIPIHGNRQAVGSDRLPFMITARLKLIEPETVNGLPDLPTNLIRPCDRTPRGAVEQSAGLWSNRDCPAVLDFA